MDAACLNHQLTDEERRSFDEEGYFVVRDVLPPATLARVIDAADRLYVAYRPRYGLNAHERLNHLDCIGFDEAFLELIDWPRTFAKVIDILGWHIQLYHSHLIITPPPPPGDPLPTGRLGWHQDSGRLNIDFETDPRPRVSLKVAFVLTDIEMPDRGSTHVIPGSHRFNKLEWPPDDAEHPDATPVRARAGDALFFDRRLWHASGRNVSRFTRKMLFLGYSYRWLRPRDDMTVEHYLEDADPIRRQLLGVSPTGGMGYTSPTDEDVPLKGWLEQHLGESAVIA
ncbi:MAG: phytanoyl-CoA dioxygenase family protein [Gammaproteobacteria bacterium]|nr:phytanoyl-CoA dioxygenase family protein [Gammaproteobacteria bacterium]MDE0223972.1 phytanoyl-CoA dioxygenase family protein [Gammaproteobacteria bacterium]